VTKTITKEAVRSLDIQLPKRNIQDEVVKFYYSLSRKITLNTKTNQTLEKLAQAIFKSWFVDFDPVKAKEKLKKEGGDLDSIAKELGMSKEILELFPDEFEESELGLIPKGWEAKSFGNLLSKTIGGDWGKEKPDEKHTEKVKILRGTDLPNVYIGSDERVPIRYVDPKKLASRKIDAGDIVIEVSGGSPTQPTGRSLYVTKEIIKRLDENLEPASFCKLFRPIDNEIGLILGLHLKKIYEDGKTWEYQNQSTGISNFQTKIFLEKEIVIVPLKQLISFFYSLITPYMKKISSAENNKLIALRDTLLPKLLSGEITIDPTEVSIDE